MLDWKLLYQKIESAERILLSTHENPDGDGLGSAYAMYHHLKNLKKDCRVIHISELPSEYNFFNNDNAIETYNSGTHDDWILNIDLALIFDVGDFRRLRDIGEVLIDNSKHVINIDHHPDLSDGRFAENFINIDAAATGEMVYDYLKTINVDLTKPMAEGIYTAVMTDTGSFCYSNTNQKCHQIAIESIDLGVNTSKIYQTVYENRSPAQVALLGELLHNLDYDSNGELAWFSIDQEMLKKVGAKNKNVDGFTDFVRSIKGVEISIMFFELNSNTVRINFRSKGKYVINGIAKSFSGGGHKFAAGALAKGNLQIIVSKVLEKTKESILFQNGNSK